MPTAHTAVMDRFFIAPEAGDRYDQYRPKVHGVIGDWLRQQCPDRRFARAVDVACGTGDSLIPLQDLADEVVGIDASEEMLAVARRRGLPVRQADYTALPELGRFDLISTCMAFHWFDGEAAIAAYKAASLPGAIWLIYNFGFAGHATNEAFNHWLKGTYLVRYPTPPRNRDGAAQPKSDPDLETIASEHGILPLTFTRESLIGYLTTQSNIEAALRAGVDLEAVTEALQVDLADIDCSGTFHYAYTWQMFRYPGV